MMAGLIVGLPVVAVSQGLDGASLDVSIAGADGATLNGATVTLVDVGNGAVRRALSAQGGHARFDNLSVGTYRLDTRMIGFAPSSRHGINLHLGDRLRVQLVLEKADATKIDSVIVRSSTLSDPGAGGPAASVSRQQLAALPLINRDFVGLLGTSSLATGPSSG